MKRHPSRRIFLGARTRIRVIGIGVEIVVHALQGDDKLLQMGRRFIAQTGAAAIVHT